jgi:hypothetical protein
VVLWENLFAEEVLVLPADGAADAVNEACIDEVLVEHEAF